MIPPEFEHEDTTITIAEDSPFGSDPELAAKCAYVVVKECGRSKLEARVIAFVLSCREVSLRIRLFGPKDKRNQDKLALACSMRAVLAEALNTKRTPL